jgi:hypothetical protein
MAEDVIKGEAAHTINGRGLSVSQIKPKGLSLFELGILANVIHEEDPSYSVFSHQCYWFMGTMFAVVELLWGNELSEEEPGRPTPNQYLPKQLGKWKNMSVNPNPDDSDMLKMAEKFKQRRDVEFSLVNFYYF